MITLRSSDNYDPIAWLGRIPVYVVTIIVGIHVACMVGVTIILSLGNSDILQGFTFNTQDFVRHGQVWRILTYAFINPPDLWVIVSLAMLYIFGRDVEQRLGHKGFASLYLGFLILGPSLFLTASLVTGQAYSLDRGWANFAVFLTFAAIHPNAQLIFQVTAKIFAWVALGVFVAQLFAWQRVPEAFVLLSTAGLAWYSGHRCSLGWGGGHPQKIGGGESPKKTQKRNLKNTVKDDGDPHRIIDPLLEKISREGMGSLTRKEREQLERGRILLLGKQKI